MTRWLVLAAGCAATLALTLNARNPRPGVWGRSAPNANDKQEENSPPVDARDVAPLVEKYCLRCHSGAKPKGGVALDRDKDDAAVLKNRAVWEKVGDNLRSGDMPPAGAKKPTAAEMERLN